MCDYRTTHIHSSSGTRDRRTDADNAEIKFMFSSQRFPLATAHVFDLGDFDAADLLFLAAGTVESKTFLRRCRRISPFLSRPFPNLHSLLAFICLCLSGQRKFVVLAICSLLVLSALPLFSYSAGPREKLPTLKRVRACLSHDPKVCTLQQFAI